MCREQYGKPGSEGSRPGYTRGSPLSKILTGHDHTGAETVRDLISVDASLLFLLPELVALR
jgi:hypothetical protein